ncbi:hypothetical protein T4E_612, partial [Trichinella pseudospiralis]
LSGSPELDNSYTNPLRFDDFERAYSPSLLIVDSTLTHQRAYSFFREQSAHVYSHDFGPRPRFTVSGNFLRLSDSSLFPPRITILGGGQFLTALTSVAIPCRDSTVSGTNPFGFARSAILLSSAAPPALCGSLPVPKFHLKGK